MGMSEFLFMLFQSLVDCYIQETDKIRGHDNQSGRAWLISEYSMRLVLIVPVWGLSAKM